MKKDGGLRPMFRERLKGWQFSSIESAGSAIGVPDLEFCTPSGVQGWIECKVTKIFTVQMSALQAAWIDRRSRYGGNIWISVRRTPVAKIYENVDELWLVNGSQAKDLRAGGLRNIDPQSYTRYCGGPSRWDWDSIERTLINGTKISTSGHGSCLAGAA
jgi:hypothetical protein